MNQFDLLHDVKAGKHLYQFYRSDEDYLTTLTAYFKAGLDCGDACLWLIADELGIPKVLEYLSTKIENIDFYRTSGQLTLTSANEWYLVNGHMSEVKSLSNAKAFIDTSFESGYKRIRACGDTRMIPTEDRADLQSYEIKVGEMLKDMSVIALCTYPILKCSLQDTKMVIDHHDDVLVSHL